MSIADVLKAIRRHPKTTKEETLRELEKYNSLHGCSEDDIISDC